MGLLESLLATGTISQEQYDSEIAKQREEVATAEAAAEQRGRDAWLSERAEAQRTWDTEYAKWVSTVPGFREFLRNYDLERDDAKLTAFAAEPQHVKLYGREKLQEAWAAMTVAKSDKPQAAKRTSAAKPSPSSKKRQAARQPQPAPTPSKLCHGNLRFPTKESTQGDQWKVNWKLAASGLSKCRHGCGAEAREKDDPSLLRREQLCTTCLARFCRCNNNKGACRYRQPMDSTAPDAEYKMVQVKGVSYSKECTTLLDFIVVWEGADGQTTENVENSGSPAFHLDEQKCLPQAVVEFLRGEVWKQFSSTDEFAAFRAAGGQEPDEPVSDSDEAGEAELEPAGPVILLPAS